MKKKFKIKKVKDGYIVYKRSFFYFYDILYGYKIYNSVEECITFIHTIYYPDECEIKIEE